MTALTARWSAPLLWVLVVVMAGRLAWTSTHVLTRHSDGFGAYYTSARLLRAGDGGPQLYDDRWFEQQVTTMVPVVRDIYTPNPPTAAMLLLPLSWAGYATARTIWIALSLLLLAVSLAVIVYETKLRGPFAPLFLAVALASQPLMVNVRQGQAYILLLALTVPAWVGVRRHHNALAGVPIGAMLVLKTAGVMLPILFLARRRGQALVWGALTGLGLIALSFVWVSVSTWRAYLTALMRIRSEPDLSVTAYQSSTALFHHFFVFDASWNPEPIVRAPMVGAALSLIVTLTVLAVTVASTLQSRDDDLAFAALITAAVLVSPLSLDYHYMFLLLPLAIMLARAQDTASRWSWLILGLSAFLMFAELPYTSPRVSHGLWALLAYPKLAGSLLLWGESLWLMHRPSESTSTAATRVATAAG